MSTVSFQNRALFQESETSDNIRLLRLSSADGEERDDPAHEQYHQEDSCDNRYHDRPDKDQRHDSCQRCDNLKLQSLSYMEHGILGLASCQQGNNDPDGSGQISNHRKHLVIRNVLCVKL